MSLFSSKEVLNLKLSSIPSPRLKQLALSLGLDSRGTVTEIIKKILNIGIDEGAVDELIKQQYEKVIEERRKLISDKDLRAELMKVKTFSWGVVQGQLDQKIQTQYVRKIVRYNDLLSNVRDTLHQDVTNYVICTWFNHWTTVLIEEHISAHARVVPTLKNVKGTDVFFDGQPFDLKVTYLPRNYDPADAVKNPSGLAIWMYEHQGAQRFGADNRLFVVLLDKHDREKSWELKRDFDLVFRKIDDFFDTESVSEKDEVIFTFGRRTHTAVTKVLLITK